MTKTPDETKKGLECCHVGQACECTDCPYSYEGEETMNCDFLLGEDALALIQQLEAQVPRWIPVEERLPEAKLAVLGFGIRSRRHGEQDPFPSEHIVYTRGEDEGWFTYWDGKHVKVTHWMPLPESPEEEPPC